jgi:hypothetical protein
MDPAPALLRGIVVSARKDRIANEDHVGDADAKGFVELPGAIGLVDPRSGDVDGGGASKWNENAGISGARIAFIALCFAKSGTHFSFSSKGAA